MKKLGTQTAFAALVILAVLATESVAATSQNIAISSNGKPSVAIPTERINALALSSEPTSNIEPSMRIATPIRMASSELLGITSGMDLPTGDSEDLLTEDPEIEKLKGLIPKTIDEAEAKILPPRNRFLMWTRDIEHVMWGYYRNGFFVGKDNHGIRAWGVYGNGYFAGLYDGEFFWGKYRDGRWKAKGLFGEQETTHGGYASAPAIVAVTYAENMEIQADYLIPSRASADLTMATQDYGASRLPSLSIMMPDEAEELKKRIPSNPEEAEEAIGPLKGRFLMWTRDLRHIMWGRFGNGYFAGTDNLGKRAWGLYGVRVFAGLYDGEFFWGFYGNGRWRAFGLFGMRRTQGRYLTAKNS